MSIATQKGNKAIKAIYRVQPKDTNNLKTPITSQIHLKGGGGYSLDRTHTVAIYNACLRCTLL